MLKLFHWLAKTVLLISLSTPTLAAHSVNIAPLSSNNASSDAPTHVPLSSTLLREERGREKGGITITTTPSQEKLTVLLDWFANPDHAPLFVAEQQGFFRDAGLDVVLINPADPADPPKLVAAGKADIAITYEPQLLEQIEYGLPLVRIATLIDRPLSCLVVLKSSGIHDIAALKNKRIGYSGTGSMTSIELQTMLAQHHLKPTDVELINVHYDLTQALLAKKIDAVSGMIRTYETIQLEQAGQPAQVFYPEDNGVPPYSELVFVINKKNLHDPRLPKFLAALQRGRDYLRDHPQESWKLFAKLHPELDDELNHRAWLATLPYFAKKPAEFNKNSWSRFAQFMQKNGLISKVRPVDDYAITIH